MVPWYLLVHMYAIEHMYVPIDTIYHVVHLVRVPVLEYHRRYHW